MTFACGIAQADRRSRIPANGVSSPSAQLMSASWTSV
jgi:hypothetical protein